MQYCLIDRKRRSLFSRISPTTLSAIEIIQLEPDEAFSRSKGLAH
jgi:hypothetical protein